MSKYAAVHWHTHCIHASLDEELFEDMQAFLKLDVAVLWFFLQQYRSTIQVGATGNIVTIAKSQMTTAIEHFKVTFDMYCIHPSWPVTPIIL